MLSYKTLNDAQFYGKEPINDTFMSFSKEITKGFNPIINGDLILYHVEYWLFWFKPKVTGCIHVPDLKSKILYNLLREPSAKRQLAYNLMLQYEK